MAREKYYIYGIVEVIDGIPTMIWQDSMEEKDALAKEVNLKEGQKLVYAEEWSGKRNIK